MRNMHLSEGPIRDMDPEEININHLKKYYLKGFVELFVDEDGRPFEDAWWNMKLSQGINLVEEYCEITTLPQRRVELHDYEIEQVHQYLLVRLWRPPVRMVEHFSAIYPATFTSGGIPGWMQGASTVKFDDIPGDQIAFDFPQNWIKIRESGQVQIVPLAGGIDTAFLGVGSTYLPLLFGAIHALPQLWRVQYICGFFNSRIPFIICDAIFKAATIECLTWLGELLRPPGVTNMSVGLEGVMRRYNFDVGKARGYAAMFSDIHSKYRKDLFGDESDRSLNHVGGMLQKIKDKYHGIDLEAI